MCFGQLTFHHSLRDVTTTLNALDGKRYRMRFRSTVRLITFSDANATRPWQMYQDLAMGPYRLELFRLSTAYPPCKPGPASADTKFDRMVFKPTTRNLLHWHATPYMLKTQ